MALRLLVIMNPSAHDWEARDRWPQLQPILASKAQVTLVNTLPDNAQTIALVSEHVQAGFDRVLAIGGDGTVHLVCSGILRAGVKTLPEFAVIPFGTANNVAKSLALPLDNMEAMARIAAGTQLGGLDVGVLTMHTPHGPEHHHWVNCVGVGMDADIVAARAKYRKLGSYVSYAAALAERTLEQRSMDVQLTLDAAEEQARVFNVVVTNVPLYVGALHMPGVRMDDGILDVHLFNRNEYGSKVMSYLIKQGDVLGVGVHEMLDEITRNQRSRQAKNIKIRLAFPRQVQVDGEGMGEADELTMSVAAHLRVARP